MSKKIAITESQLKRLLENTQMDEQSRAAQLSASFSQRTPPVTSKAQPTSNNTRGGKAPQSSSKLTTGVYKNSTIEVLSNGSLKLNVYGKGTFTYICDGCKPIIKSSY